MLRKLDHHNFEKRIVGYEWMEACLADNCVAEPSVEHIIRPLPTPITINSTSTT